MKKSFYFKNIFVSILILLMNIKSSNPQLIVDHRGKGQVDSADSFVDSIGVVTHIERPIFSQNFDSVILPRLQELGVHHIRDGGHTQQFISKLKILANIGIKSTLTMDIQGNHIYPTSVEANASGVLGATDALTIVKAAANSVEAISGPNEVDLAKRFLYKGQLFPESAAEYQKDLFSAIKNDSVTKHLPVLMFPLGHPENIRKLCVAPTVCPLLYADIGNMHSYPGGHEPDYQLDSYWILKTQQQSGSKPIVATESGYHNAVNKTNVGQRGVSELASSKYIPRLLLEYFLRKTNIKRVFIYELMDESTDSNNQINLEYHYGLLRNNGSPKPAFVAMKNLINILVDKGANFRTGSLNYQLFGDVINVKHIVLQKQNGDFYLVIWGTDKSFDLITKTDIKVLPHSVMLSLKTSIKTATLYNPLQSTNAVNKSFYPKKMQLNVPDYPLIIRLEPQ